jgi:Exonuclease VII small subunit
MEEINKDNFEEALNGLKTMSEKIKAQDTSLEEAIKCYEEGMKYYKVCNDIIENAKQSIRTYGGEDL